jgi:hypothetical protein
VAHTLPYKPVRLSLWRWLYWLLCKANYETVSFDRAAYDARCRIVGRPGLGANLPLRREKLVAAIEAAGLDSSQITFESMPY